MHAVPEHEEPPEQSESEALAWEIADSQKRRADYMADLVYALGDQLGPQALDECADAIERELRTAEPRGVCPEAKSAWTELAQLLDDSDNLLHETALDELRSMAVGKLRALDPTRRAVLWLSYRPPEAKEGGELWYSDGPRDFDPATAWRGCMDRLVGALVADVRARMPAGA